MSDSPDPNILPKRPVIFLMGPTASGKTDLAIMLSKKLPIDLISVDSALVYRGLDIGSAKPEPEVLRQFPHELIDIRDPSESYSAADFQRDAMLAIEASHAANRIPLLVGGTMLYFKALIDGLADMPPTDLALRAEIETRAAEYGWSALHEELRQVDPETAARIHPNHSVRIERALQVYHAAGVPLSALHADQGKSDFAQRYELKQFAILPRDRAVLHARIAKRLDSMFENGFLEEVESLYRRGDLDSSMSAIRAVGYRQIWSYLDGEISLEEAKQKALFATRKLAKRQLTWLRSWHDLNLLYTQDIHGGTLSSESIESLCLKLLHMDQY